MSFLSLQFREGYPEVSARNKLFSMIKSKGMLLEGTEDVEIVDALKPAKVSIVWGD
jgi:hypothetical protein